MKNARDRVLVVGLARNLEESLFGTIHKMLQIFSPLFETDFFVVESDSEEKMHSLLRELEAEIPNFSFKSLGNLREEIPDRVERIRYCRNIYVDHIRNQMAEQRWKYVVVSDLDGINTKLNTESIRAVTNFKGKWTVLTCNQTAPYYDIYALRSKQWVEYDCITETRKLEKQLKEQLAKVGWTDVLKRKAIKNQIASIRKKLIYDKMKRISPNSEPIVVDSAFGGMAFYRPEIFMAHDYSKSPDIQSECEHVTLHRKIRKDLGTILILPNFINCGWNEHSLNKISLVRHFRRSKSALKKLVEINSIRYRM